MRLTYFCIVLLLLPIVSGQSLYSGWLNAGGDVSVAGINYYIQHNHGDKKVIISAAGSSFLLQEGNCKMIGSKEVCLIELDDNIDSSRVVYEGGVPRAGINIEIFEVRPKVSIDREINPAELKLNEQGKITVTLTNQGTAGIDEFVYEDEFPEGIRVLQSKAGENKFVRKGSLEKGESLTFEYNVKMEKFVEHVSQGVLTYKFGESEQVFKSQAVRIKARTPYEISSGFNKENYFVGEKFRFDFSIKNTDDKNLSVKNFILSTDLLPETIDGGLNETREGYFWKGVLGSDGVVTFRSYFSADITGDYELTLKGVFQDSEDEAFEYFQEEKIRVNFREVSPKLVIIPETVSGGKEFKVRASVKNKGEVQIEIIESFFSVGDVYLTGSGEFVKQDEEEALFQESFAAPEVDKEKLFLAVFQGKYRTKAGDTFSFKDEKYLKVIKEIVVEEVVVDTQPVEGSEDTEEAKEIDEEVTEEKSFVGRVIARISGFFSKLFG